MWRSKAVLIACRVSAAIKTTTRTYCAGTSKVRISATTHKSQVIPKIRTRFYSSSAIENGGFTEGTATTATGDFAELVAKTASEPTNEESGSFEEQPTEDPVTLEGSESVEPATKCAEDAEQVGLLLKKKTETEQLETELETLALNVTRDLVRAVIKTPDVRTEQIVRFFKWSGRQPNFTYSPRLMNTITLFLCKKGGKKNLDLLRGLMEETAENHDGVVTTAALNTLIYCLGRSHRAKEALEVFQQFNRFKCQPSSKSYFIAIDVFCNGYLFDEARSAFEEMDKAGHFPSLAKSSKIIRWFCKGKRPNDAYAIYLKVIEKGNFPRVVAANGLIDSLCNVAETPEIAAEIAQAFPAKKRKLALKSYFTVILSLCKKQRIEEAQKLLSRMMVIGPAPDNAVFNTIITALCKAEKPEEAMPLLEQMSSRKLKPDIYAYNVIMSSLAKSEKMEEACEMFSKAKEAGIKRHSISYNILIDGFCRLGNLEKAQEYFSEWKESGRSPNADAYSKLIRAYCMKGLDWRSAKELLDEMVERGLSPSDHTRSLISALKELQEEALQAEGGLVKA